jgi:flagellar hook protein FlgE
MSFQTGLSGLNTSSQNLDVIGNNVANASVVGFKSSNAQFSDVFASALSGAGAGSVGIGSKVQGVAQQFVQGNISVTSNPLDVAINGKGFFRINDNGSILYSRNGQFHFDKDGYIVNADNKFLTGYLADFNGNIITANPSPMQISTSDLSPQATSDFRINVNLDARKAVPTTAIFDPADPTSYTVSTSGSVFDSLGNAHALSFYFVKTATTGTWDAYATVDGGPTSAVNLGSGAGNATSLTFDNLGALTAAMPIATASVDVTTGAVTPLTFSLDFTGSTQYGATFGVNALSQDGYTSGRLAGFNISPDGVIQGRYSNGQTKNLAQIVVADFVNPQGLRPMGNNLWEESSASGQPLVGTPNAGAMGSLNSSALEDSNVDLTSELVQMIVAQRVYQANAQSIKTQDAVLQTLVNLR